MENISVMACVMHEMTKVGALMYQWFIELLRMPYFRLFIKKITFL